MRALLAAMATVFIFNLSGGSALAQSVCDTHHLGYTKPQCDMCSNMTWSVSRVFPRGVCAARSASPSAPPASSCTLTRWGGVTLPLRAANFSATGAPIGVCRNGYDLAKSQLRCSTGAPARALNAPNTNITCNYTTAVGGNPQVTITGTPCCLQ